MCWLFLFKKLQKIRIYQEITCKERPFQDRQKKKISSISPKYRRSRTSRDFESLVGKAVYGTWIAMLKELLPGGRTHRLSVIVAGMLHYAWRQEADSDNSVRAIIEEAEGADYEEMEGLLIPLVEQLFKDAGVKWKRKNSKGHGYSIAEDSIQELFNWDFRDCKKVCVTSPNGDKL